MRYFLLFILFTLCCFVCSAQPFIHAHNDYQKPDPLTNALRNKVFSVETDIYLSGNRLLVAHDRNELVTARTLESLYLQPIIELFRQNKGTISEDSNYAAALMIDIKENGDLVIAELIKLLSLHPFVFDRSVNKKAVLVVLSGDRGAISKWSSYPSYIFFDGRPYEEYDSATLHRVAFISDSWAGYTHPPADDYERLKLAIEKVHHLRKFIRLWASPDNPESWKMLQQLGIDIINTDKVAECRDYFSKK